MAGESSFPRHPSINNAGNGGNSGIDDNNDVTKRTQSVSILRGKEFAAPIAHLKIFQAGVCVENTWNLVKLTEMVTTKVVPHNL